MTLIFTDKYDKEEFYGEKEQRRKNSMEMLKSLAMLGGNEKKEIL